MTSSSSSLALTLLLVVTLTGVLPSASSRALVGVAPDGALEDHDELQLLMMERFHGWMAAHGRSYATAVEKMQRFDIYRSNVEFIEAANRDGRLTYKLGENQFTDLTHEEFLATYTSRAAPPDLMTGEEGMVITTRAGDVNEPVADEEPREDLSEQAVPESVNWKDLGKVTPVKDQRDRCGACWAFAAVAAIESAHAIKKGETPPVLSEQELIDCDSFDDGCTRGLPYNGFRWVRDNGGIAKDSQYPYKETKGMCQSEKLQLHAATVRDYNIVRENNEERLMEAVAAQPVAVLFDATDPCFKWYKSGVYNGHCIIDGVYVGPCSTDNLHHAMAIVGYVGNNNSWIAKNSWGTGWGMQGYVHLRKDVPNPEGLCGLAIRPSYPRV